MGRLEHTFNHFAFTTLVIGLVINLIAPGSLLVMVAMIPGTWFGWRRWRKD